MSGVLRSRVVGTAVVLGAMVAGAWSSSLAHATARQTAEAAARDASGPKYKGRTAGEWTMALGSGQWMDAIRALRAGDPESLPVLRELAKSEHSAVRVTAVGGLADLGSAAKEALPTLQSALGDKDLNVRYWAASALTEIGPPAAPAVAALIAALSTHPTTEPDLEGPPRYYKDARAVAAQALGAIGPAARAAVPRLREVAAQDEADEVRSAAAEALRRIESTPESP